MLSARQIVLNSKTAGTTTNGVLRLKFPSGGYTTLGEEIAVSNLFMYYSWYNISAANGNNQLSIIVNGTTTALTIPDGSYSISDLNGWLLLQYDQLGYYLVDANGNNVYFGPRLEANPVYYCVTLTCTQIPSSLGTYTNPRSLVLSGTTSQLVIPSTNIRNLLGFNAGTFPSSPAASTYQKNSDFTGQVSPVYVCNIACNFVNDNSFQTGYQASSIYTFSPSTTAFGGQIQERPYQLQYYPVLDGFYQELELRLVDQNGNLIDLKDPNWQVVLSLRKKY